MTELLKCAREVVRLQSRLTTLESAAEKMAGALEKIAHPANESANFFSFNIATEALQEYRKIKDGA